MDDDKKSRWEILKPITIPGEKEFREAIRINPNDAEAHFSLGISLYYLKRYDKAEKEFREAKRVGSDLA